MSKTAKSELSNIFPEFIDQSGKLVLPTSGQPDPVAAET
jgi:hypothetical protein